MAESSYYGNKVNLFLFSFRFVRTLFFLSFLFCSFLFSCRRGTPSKMLRIFSLVYFGEAATTRAGSPRSSTGFNIAESSAR